METMDDSFVSDADSDELELRLENAKFEREVQEFLDTHGDFLPRPPPPQPRKGKVHRQGLFRSSRREVEPRPDIKLRLMNVNAAFLRGDYEEAEAMIHEIIRINAETYQAWVTLGTILEDQGRLADALTARLYASFLRDKDDAAWVGCADMALVIAGDDDDSPLLKTASMCFANAIKANPQNNHARLGRADVNHRRGHINKAIFQYSGILKRQPHDIDVIRKLADACDASQDDEQLKKAIAVYLDYIDYARNADPSADGAILWADISIFVDLLMSAGDFSAAATHLKSLARWRLGRQDETFWDERNDDDLEWDRDDSRRLSIPEFSPGLCLPHQYGPGLPLELRAQLALCRVKLGQFNEARLHLSWIDPRQSATAVIVENFHGLLKDIAHALFAAGERSQARDYFELLRNSVYGQDPELLFKLGACYVDISDTGSAEDCFLRAIELDEMAIEARVELARIYEKAHEDEEALILVTEAIALQDLQGGPRNQPPDIFSRTASGTPDIDAQPGQQPGRKPGSGVARRYRPKRLVGADQRIREERDRADELSRRYKEVRRLKEEIRLGNRSLVAAWEDAARDLVDDFRSFRKFYTWDKYVKYLGAAKEMVFNAPHQMYHPGSSELHKFAERLSRNVNPVQSDDRRPLVDEGYRGIPFGEWLELFLDYAICLAIGGNGNEAYSVCEAARDSIVFINSKDYMFLIHVAWAACAIYMADDEVCVAMGRFFTKVYQLDSDAYRMFAALCRLCQSPASWYNSGPVQKFILRQIRVIDATQMRVTMPDAAVAGPSDLSTAEGETRNLDVCLLMLYGHILFTSTSYTFALNYFLRARSLAPENPMVNLSVGLGYLHHGLKRQAENRQFLVMQGLASIFQYAESAMPSSADDSQGVEVRFTIARALHMLGLHHLAHEGYSSVVTSSNLGEAKTDGHLDAVTAAAFNQYILLVTSRDISEAEHLIQRQLIL